jgi:hypothetical protein
MMPSRDLSAWGERGQKGIILILLNLVLGQVTSSIGLGLFGCL